MTAALQLPVPLKIANFQTVFSTSFLTTWTGVSYGENTKPSNTPGHPDPASTRRDSPSIRDRVLAIVLGLSHRPSVYLHSLSNEK